MNVPTCLPVPHLPIAILELIVNEHAAECKRLGRILAALRSELSPLAHAVSRTEVIPAAPVKCKHGLRDAWCATCAKLSRSSQSKAYVNARHFSFQNAPLDITGIDWVESLDLLADEKAEEARSAEVKKCTKATHREEKRFVTPPTELVLTKMFVSPLVEGRAWEEARAARVEVVKKQTLTEYAALHQDDEAATLPHLSDFCVGCRMHVTNLHDSVRCADKKIAEQRANTEWTAKNNRKLDARGWVGYSPEALDRDILESRGSITAEAVKQFDRDLSRKGNKYRIQ